MKGSFFCKAMLLTLMVSLVFGLIACAPQNSMGNDFLASINVIENSDESSEEQSDDDVSVPEGQAHAPVITNVLNVTATQIIVTGTCDEGCTVTITDGEKAVTVNSIEGYFVAEYYISSTAAFTILSASAESEELEKSKITSFRADYNSTAIKRIDGLGVTMGSNSHFYYDTDLSYYIGRNTLLTQTQIKQFKSFVNSKVTSFEKRAGNSDVKLVYVLVPNRITIYPEYLAESTTKETYKTRFDQIAEALGETNAEFIDMTEAFIAAKANGDKLYYNTDNHLTEYGGYLVYKAICDMMSERFPDAAAKSLEEDFTSETLTLNGGNTAGHLGLNTKVVTELTTLYTPKFTLSLGKEDSTITTASGLIKDFSKYSGTDSMLLATGKNSLSSRLLFATNRTSLPCALVYRDDFAVSFSDILAERFNKVLLAQTGDFTINMTDAQRYYGKNQETGSDNTTVDYIIIIVSESNLGSIIG
ncbi:MAG: hypothetical protein PHW77_03720 [Eubacteriales bacterium]|nr:hypothetical protein [Eubacteriales bacterium]